jgi:hypothetical protein
MRRLGAALAISFATLSPRSAFVKTLIPFLRGIAR